MYEILALDLDNTLLDTYRFYDAAVQVLVEAFGIDGDLFKREQQLYNYYNGPLHHYDFFTHVEAIGLDSNRVEAILRRKLDGLGLFADVMPVLKQLPTTVDTFVLSYGEARFQGLKHACSGLSVPIYTVLTPKGPWLEARYHTKQGLMVDDRIVTDLPSGFTFELIDRKNSNPDAWQSLDFLLEYF